MKRLYLIRHAKSSWNDPRLMDHDRPLNDRGNRDLPVMASHIRAHYGLPALVITSSAKRAQKTAQGFARSRAPEPSQLIVDEELYLCSPPQALNSLRQNAVGSSVGLVGHNPGWTDFVNHIEGVWIDNVPTCGVAIIECDTEEWSSVHWEHMRLVEFVYPKGIS